MKRDMELFRELLLAIESDCKDGLLGYQLLPEGTWEPVSVFYNLELMMDAGFIEARKLDGEVISVERMTWAGHEFLDIARDETIWKKAKTILKNKGIALEGVGFGMLTQVLSSVAK